MINVKSAGALFLMTLRPWLDIDVSRGIFRSKAAALLRPARRAASPQRAVVAIGIVLLSLCWVFSADHADAAAANAAPAHPPPEAERLTRTGELLACTVVYNLYY